MSKIEIVERLNDSAPQLEIVRSVRELQEIVKSLPDAVASEAVQALEPLYQMQPEFKKTLTSIQTLVDLQGRAIEELAQELTDKTTQSLEQRVKALDATIESMKHSASSIEKTMQQAARLPVKLDEAARKMNKAGEQLLMSAQKAKPRVWKQAILAGAIGGALVLTGQNVLNRLLPPSDVQVQAQTLQEILNKATPEERELMSQILKRPAG